MASVSELAPAGPKADQPFSLAPSIFTPFRGLPRDAAEPIRPLEREEKLQKIIENLDRQHKAVRTNMVLLVEQRAQVLTDHAKEELQRLGEGQGEDLEDVDDSSRTKKLKREVDNMLKRAKVMASDDATAEDYQLRLGSVELQGVYSTGSEVAGSDGDVEMGGTTAASRPGRVIREELSKSLRELVERGVREMDGYDFHAEKVSKHYQMALDRWNVRRASVPETSSVGPRGGILKNRHEEISITRDELRRMSTGMPLADSVVTQPVRTFSSFDEVARRGSKG